MKEIFTMWRHTQMVVLVALSAAIYAAVLIPFKSFAIVPGFIEIRPANVFPVVFGLLFGPAGAWGSAIGNLIGDFFGSLSLGSIGGFVGNFFLALIPYKLWGAYFRNRNMETNVNSGEKLAVYIATTIVASLACADIISWWLSLLGLVPFTVALALITFNNAIMGSILGPFLLLALYPRVKRWGLLWTEIMEPDEVATSGSYNTGSILVWFGSIATAVAGVFLGLSSGGPNATVIGFGLLIPLIVILIGSFMLGGREQVEAAELMDAEEETAQVR